MIRKLFLLGGLLLALATIVSAELPEPPNCDPKCQNVQESSR